MSLFLFVFLKILLRMMGTKNLQPVMASFACVDMYTSCNRIYMAWCGTDFNVFVEYFKVNKLKAVWPSHQLIFILFILQNLSVQLKLRCNLYIAVGRMLIY